MEMNDVEPLGEKGLLVGLEVSNPKAAWTILGPKMCGKQCISKATSTLAIPITCHARRFAGAEGFGMRDYRV